MKLFGILAAGLLASWWLMGQPVEQWAWAEQAHWGVKGFGGALVLYLWVRLNGSPLARKSGNHGLWHGGESGGSDGGGDGGA